jgi:hypothetical protein
MEKKQQQTKLFSFVGDLFSSIVWWNLALDELCFFVCSVSFRSHRSDDERQKR